MQDQADRLGLGLTFVDAIDGADPQSAVVMGPPVGTVTGRSRSRLDYACVSSHLKCLELLGQSGAPFGIILEDDVVLADDFGAFVDPDWFPEDADIVKLETVLTPVMLSDIRDAPVAGRKIARLQSRHLGAGGYAISAQAARRLHAEMQPPCDQIDQILFLEHIERKRDLTICQILPAPLIQGMYKDGAQSADWAMSTLEPDRVKRGIGFVQNHRARPRRNVVRAALRRGKYGLRALGARLRNQRYGIVRFG